MATLFVALATACGSPSSEEAPAEVPPSLDGAYLSADGVWTIFHANEAITWSTSAACNDPAIAPAESCATRRTFVHDVASGVVTFTDAKTGEKSVQRIRIDSVEKRESLLSGVTPKSISLIDSPSQLTSPNVATGFSLTNPGGPVQLADWKENVHLCLLIVKLIVAGEQPGSTSIPRPPPINPPAITQMEGGCKKKG